MIYVNEDEEFVLVRKYDHRYEYEYGHDRYGTFGGGSRDTKDKVISAAMLYVKNYWGPLSEMKMRKIKEVLENGVE